MITSHFASATLIWVSGATDQRVDFSATRGEKEIKIRLTWSVWPLSFVFVFFFLRCTLHCKLSSSKGLSLLHTKCLSDHETETPFPKAESFLEISEHLNFSLKLLLFVLHRTTSVAFVYNATCESILGEFLREKSGQWVTAGRRLRMKVFFREHLCL